MGNDYVRNALDGPPLPISWAKAGINRSLLRPLYGGEPICQAHWLGSLTKLPVPDPDAPILYHLDRHVDAVVYSKSLVQPGLSANNPNEAVPPPAGAPGQTGTSQPGQSGPPSDKTGSTGTRFETIITNEKGESQPISFELTMQPEGDFIGIFLRLDGHFQLGLPGLSTIFGSSNTEQLQTTLEKYGIKNSRGPLDKFTNSKGLDALFWSHNAPAGIEKLDTLFLYNGEETRKALIDLSVEKNSSIQTKTGIAIVFDNQNVPVLSTKVEYTVPVAR